MKYDAIVIGSGAGGMTAAIYLKRANLNVLVIEKSAPGGQITKTAHIENYPGFSSITGPDLATNFFTHMLSLEIPFVGEEVISIEDKKTEKIVKTNSNEYQTKGVIIATGRSPRHLGFKEEETYAGKGVSWCANCDGALFKNKTVTVVGGGNSAFEESLFLANLAKQVNIVHRSDKYRAESSTIQKVKSTANINLYPYYEIKKINGKENTLASIEIENNQDRSKVTLDTDGLFIYIGHDPVTDFAKKLNITDEAGYIITDRSMRTKTPYIYACGDVVAKEIYQVATAVGEAATAASSLINDFTC